MERVFEVEESCDTSNGIKAQFCGKSRSHESRPDNPSSEKKNGKKGGKERKLLSAGIKMKSMVEKESTYFVVLCCGL